MKNKEQWEIDEQISEARKVFADELSYTDYQIISYYNLLKAIVGSKYRVKVNYALAGGIENVLQEIDDEQRNVLAMQYNYGYNLAEIGEMRGVSRERIRQLKVCGLQYLRNNRARFIIDEHIEILEEKIQYLRNLKLGINDCDIPIEVFSLKERHIHALRNAGVETIGNLISLPSEDLEKSNQLSSAAEEVIENSREIIPGKIQIMGSEQRDIPYLIYGDNEDILKLPIKRLNLSTRSYNCLMRSGVKTIEDFLSFPEEDLLEIKNLGEKSFKEIKNKRAQFWQY